MYFIKNKGEVANHFRAFKSQVENMKDKNIKVLRTNKEGEYTSNEFINF